MGARVFMVTPPQFGSGIPVNPRARHDPAMEYERPTLPEWTSITSGSDLRTNSCV